MYVVSVFLKLELAVAELEHTCIKATDILAIPLEKPSDAGIAVDPYNTDGFNLFPVACISTVTMLLGTIYGFVLYWGPALWGLIGLAVGNSRQLQRRRGPSGPRRPHSRIASRDRRDEAVAAWYTSIIESTEGTPCLENG